MAAILAMPELADLPHGSAVFGARAAIERARSRGLADPALISCEARRIALSEGYPEAINCSGAILNTGLGRARLLSRPMQGHVALEIDLETGKRGDRQGPLAAILRELTGAEDAFVVNNNAAAVMLCVNTFARGKQVMLSRGQSVEIGGSFRLPDVVRSAGAKLLDVGCTNKTRIEDYREAYTPKAAVLLRCHPSNFKMTGFVEEPSISEMADFAGQQDIVFIDDAGSGCLIDTEKFGLPHEPKLVESIKAGSHLVTASGDKLIGGPQAGIILGKADLIVKIRKNPLARAVRIDKQSAAALYATLKMYLEGRESEIPIWKYVARTREDIRGLARDIDMEDSTCEIGGGSLPGVTLPSCRIVVAGPAQKRAKDFRSRLPAIIGYVNSGTFWLDMRTVEEDEVEFIRSALKS